VERKELLLDLLELGYAAEQAFVATLPALERNRAGTVDHWSAKDTLAHIAAWKERRAQELEAVAAGLDRPYPQVADFDQVNAELFEQHRSEPWPVVLAMLDRAHRALSKYTRALDEEHLGDTGYLPWRQGQPPWRLIVGNGYIHPISHIALYHTQQGQLELAAQMQEEAAALLAGLDSSAEWQGVVRYNLACHYALAQENERAIALLAEALQRNPGLRDWSLQDTDLDSLRNDPAYQALYANPE
jgi:tetratricopeptide (TPR) repeat protein